MPLTPDSSPLKEKENVFNHPVTSQDEKNLDTKEVEPVADEVDDDSDADKETDHTSNFIQDPFRPFDNLPEEPHRVLTIRAVFVGLCCGALVNASNVYLGLKTGWTFTANLFGAIVGFAVIKFFSKTFAKGFPILGGDFGPRENNIVQVKMYRLRL